MQGVASHFLNNYVESHILWSYKSRSLLEMGPIIGCNKQKNF